MIETPCMRCKVAVEPPVIAASFANSHPGAMISWSLPCSLSLTSFETCEQLPRIMRDITDMIKREGRDEAFVREVSEWD